MLNQILKKIKNKKLLQDESGAVALVFVLTFGIMLGGSLFAIDIVRHASAQTRIQNALDTAVISAGRKLADFDPTASSSPDEAWKQDAFNYFNINMPNHKDGVTIDNINIAYEAERTDDGRFLAAQHIKMDVSGKISMMSAGYVSIASLDINASNEAIRRTRSDIELVLALDNSGSMEDASGGRNSKSRMTVLKDSSKALINTVMDAAEAGGQSDGVHGAYIGIVPFNDVVNVGNIPTAKNWFAKWLQEYPMQSNYISNTWSGCIAEPYGDWTRTNRLPAQALTPSSGFRPLVSVYSTNAYPSISGTLMKDARFTEGFGISPYTSSTDRLVSAYMTGSGSNMKINIQLAAEPDYCARSKAIFLSDSRNNLLNSVNNMQSYGGTNVGMGLLWAWRMLDPDWRSSTEGWGDNNKPRDYRSGQLNKVIVLLSDGDNNPSGVVSRQSNSFSASANRFNLSYKYKTVEETCVSYFLWWCSQYETKDVIQEVTNQQVSFGLNSFTQCPVSGLKTVDTANITPSNYNSGCTYKSTDIGWLSGSSTPSNAITTGAFDNYMAAICTNVKAKGIKIFTVVLGKDVSNPKLMQDCASTKDNFFDASDASKLPDVFAQIAGALTELRLIE